MSQNRVSFYKIGAAATSTLSSLFTNPPINDHFPFSGLKSLLMRSALSSLPSNPKMIQSAATKSLSDFPYCSLFITFDETKGTRFFTLTRLFIGLLCVLQNLNHYPVKYR